VHFGLNFSLWLKRVTGFFAYIISTCTMKSRDSMKKTLMTLQLAPLIIISAAREEFRRGVAEKKLSPEMRPMRKNLQVVYSS
jgi:hypothetical protein